LHLLSGFIEFAKCAYSTENANERIEQNEMLDRCINAGSNYILIDVRCRNNHRLMSEDLHFVHTEISLGNKNLTFDPYNIRLHI